MVVLLHVHLSQIFIHSRSINQHTPRGNERKGREKSSLQEQLLRFSFARKLLLFSHQKQEQLFVAPLEAELVITTLNLFLPEQRCGPAPSGTNVSYYDSTYRKTSCRYDRPNNLQSSFLYEPLTLLLLLRFSNCDFYYSQLAVKPLRLNTPWGEFSGITILCLYDNWLFAVEHICGADPKF